MHNVANRPEATSTTDCFDASCNGAQASTGAEDRLDTELPLDRSLVLIALVTAVCGLPFGLLQRSAAESKRGSPEPRLFVLDGIAGLVATIVEKAIIGLTLIFVPSLALLWLIDQMPHSRIETQIWWAANLLGIALGKLMRWLRWRRTQDFV